MNDLPTLGRREFLRASLAASLVAAAGGGCALPAASRGDSARGDAASPTPPVEAIVLGTAQDGGIPHLGCRCERCRATRAGALPPRTVACLALVDRAAGDAWLVDATPDIRDQVARLLDAPGLEDRTARAPVSGIFVGHAHIGHYLGLAFLGRESIHARRMPVWASPRMAEHLRTNAPFELLVRLQNIDLRAVESGERVPLGPRLAVTPFRVPHREEYTDTFAYRIEGPDRTLVYVSDIDFWDDAAAREIERADVALLGPSTR
jgi:pyrroloquinoline quinone biosynthesis protein B